MNVTEDIVNVAVTEQSVQDNKSGGEESIDSFYFYEAEQFSVLWILLIVIVAGNCGVLFTLYSTKSRKSRMNFFISHLALSDLLVGLISVLTDIIWRMTISWNAGNFTCKLVKFLQVVVTYGSTYVLVALSIDRYDAIRHPMKFSGSWKRAKCLIIAAWLCSIIFSTPILMLYEEKSIQGKQQCWIDFPELWHWQLYMCLVSVSLFIIPAAIIAGCYAFIILTIWSKSSVTMTKSKVKGYLVFNTDGTVCPRCPDTSSKIKIECFPLGSSNRGYTVAVLTGSDNSRRVSSRGLIPRAKVKTVKITLVIVSVFILCWSPYIIFDLLQVFGYIPQTQSNIAIATFVQSLAPLNSAANPIIYCIFSTHFCKILSNIPPFKWFDCKKKKKKSRDYTMTTTTTTHTQSSSLSEVLTNNTTTTKRSSSSMADESRMINHIQLVSVH